MIGTSGIPLGRCLGAGRYGGGQKLPPSSSSRTITSGVTRLLRSHSPHTHASGQHVSSPGSLGSLDSADLEIYTLAYSMQSSRQQFVDSLCRTLGISATTATTMVAKQPKLVDIPVDVVSDRVTSLSRALRVPHDSALSLLTTHPFLALKTPQEVSQQLERVSQALGVTLAPVCKLVVKQPFVLQCSTPAVKEKFDVVCAALTQMDREQVAYLVAALPDLILVRTDAVTSNLQSLQQLFGLSPQQASEMVLKCPTLLIRQADLTQRDLFVLADYMGVSFSMAAALVARHPELLGVSWQTVKVHFDNLCTFFGNMPRDAVVELVLSNPALLPLLSNTPPSDM